MLTTREAILLKVEGTYNTDSTPSPTVDAILVSELTPTNESARLIDRPLIKPSISTEKKIFGGTLKKLTFKAELKGSGDAGVAPEIGQALRCCAMDETIVADTSVTYQPVSDNHESATIYYYQDGRLRKMTGCRGTVTFDAETGGLCNASFEFTGHDAGFADSTFPAITYHSTVPVPFINVSFQVASYGPIINSLSLNVSNTLSIAPDCRDEYGFGEVRVTSRDPNGSIDPEAVKLSVVNFEQSWKDGTVMALTTGNVGSTAGNIWKLDANIAIRDITNGEREQIRTDELSFGCHEVATDDEFTLTFL